MPEFNLNETFELQKFTKNISGLIISEILNREIINLAFHIKNEKVAKSLFKKTFNIDFPDYNLSKYDKKNDCRFLRMSEDQLFLIYEKEFGTFLLKNKYKLEKYFYFTEQTDAWSGIKISGEKVRECLARICLLNLNEKKFPKNSFARTHIEHLGSVVIYNGHNEFELFSAKSSSLSFLNSVITSAMYM